MSRPPSNTFVHTAATHDTAHTQLLHTNVIGNDLWLGSSVEGRIEHGPCVCMELRRELGPLKLERHDVRGGRQEWVYLWRACYAIELIFDLQGIGAWLESAYGAAPGQRLPGKLGPLLPQLGTESRRKWRRVAIAAGRLARADDTCARACARACNCFRGAAWLLHSQPGGRPAKVNNTNT